MFGGSLQAERVQVQLLGLAGSLGCVEVLGTDTLRFLREKVAEQCGIPAFEQQLIHGTQVVEEIYGTLDHEQLRTLFRTAGRSLTLTVVRVATPVVAEDLIHRKVAQLLKAASSESLETLMARFNEEVKLHNGEQLQLALRMIFARARMDPNHVQVYVDILRSLYPHYQALPPASPGDRPLRFRQLLADLLQEDYRAFRTASTQAVASQQLPQILCFMKFLGLLYVKELTSERVLGSFFNVLLRAGDVTPPKHVICCLCELLRSCGHAMEGQPLLLSVISRLTELQTRPDASPGIVNLIQDLLNLRAHRWVRGEAGRPAA